VQVDAQYGETEKSDGIQQTYSITTGGNFADDKGNAVLSFTYADRGQIYNAARAFSQYSGASGTLPFGSVSTTFSQAAVDAVFAKYGFAAGTVGKSSKISFNSDGTLFAFANPAGATAITNYKGPTTIDYSTITNGAGSVGTGSYNTGALNDLVLPLQRYTTYARSEYEINRYAHVYAQVMFTDYSASEELAPSPASGSPLLSQVSINGQLINVAGGTGFLVPLSNPFIPADLRTLLASRASPTAPFLIAKRFSDVGPRHEDDHYNVYNIVIGSTGDVGFKDWTYDAYATYGRESLIATQTGNVSHAAVRQLLEAPDGGASLCTGGYNIFGNTPSSASCLAYISRTTKNATAIEDRTVEASMQGTLFDLPAGGVKFAAGTDYHSQAYSFVPDSVLSTIDSGTDAFGDKIYAPGVVGFNSANALKGSVDAYELFGELSVPLLKDLPLIKALNANLGYRYSDYSTAGGVNSYKIDGEWRPIDHVLFRGGFQHAVRAPSIGELFAPQNNNFPTIGAAGANSTAGDPCDINSAYRKGNLGFSAAQVRALCLAQGVPAGIVDTYSYSNNQVQALVGGNTNLSAETANTYSLGAVFTPNFDMPLFHRMSLSVDYYNIQVKHVIGTVSTVTAIDKCFNAQNANPTYSNSNIYCSYFIRDPSTGQVLTGNGTNANLGQIKTSGEDIQFDWAFGLGAVGLKDRYGSLTFNTVITHLESFKSNDVPGSPFNEFAGTIGGFGGALPEWKALTTLTYTVGPVDLSARWQYIDKMMDGSLVGAAAGATAISPPAVNYFDLLGRWRINDTFEVRAGVNNLTNKQPPFFTSFVQANTDPSTYDIYGRRYYLALKARF
jgi:outer membrane receptor protein involved in Fe transport